MLHVTTIIKINILDNVKMKELKHIEMGQCALFRRVARLQFQFGKNNKITILFIDTIERRPTILPPVIYNGILYSQLRSLVNKVFLFVLMY